MSCTSYFTQYLNYNEYLQTEEQHTPSVLDIIDRGSANVICRDTFVTVACIVVWYISTTYMVP